MVGVIGRVGQMMGRVGASSPSTGGGYDPRRALAADLLEYWDALLAPEAITLSGSEVVTWASGVSGLAPTQATEANRPSFNATALAGGPCLVFDGSADNLSVSGVGNLPTGSAPCEIWVLGSQDAPISPDAGERTFFSYGNGGGVSQHRSVRRVRVTTPSNLNRAKIIAGDDAAGVTLTGAQDLNGPCVIRARFEASAMKLWVNGVYEGEQAVTLAGTATTRTRIGALANFAGIDLLLGKIGAIYVTSLLTGKEVALENYLLQRGGFDAPAIEPPGAWASVAPQDPITYNGINWGVHTAALERSIALSTSETNLVRFELQEGDEWPSDEGRVPAYDRAELGAYQQGLISGGNEFWYSFAVRGWGLAEVGTIAQVFSDSVEFMLQQGEGRLTWQTFAPDGTNTARHASVPIQDGAPDQFVIRFKARNDGTGELESWRNGVRLFGLTGLSYGVDGPTNQKRPKYGIYRQRRGPTATLHYANFRVGSDLSDKIASPDPLPPGWRSPKV